MQRKACYLAMAINLDGDRDVLGMWFQANEGAKFWMQVLTELKQRGVAGHPDLLRRRPEGVPRSDRGRLPQTTVQTCIVHLIRQSLKYVPRRQYDAGRQRPASRSTPRSTPTQAMVALEAFEEKWGEQIPMIGQAWREAGST